jgi:membrane fusion protein (multidrug efflux system)
VEGRVTAILIEEGEPVEQGAIVFEIDRERRQLELVDAQARLQEAHARLDQQQRETQRVRRLHASNSASEAKLDASETELRLAGARLDAARAGLGLAERALRKASVVAPFSGILARRRITEGEFVTPGAELFDLIALDPIEIEFHVPERDSGRVAVGQSLQVRVAPFPDEVFDARVSMLSPRIDRRSRTLRVKATLANQELRLRPGLFARADLGLAERTGVPMVPETALLQRADGTVVFRLVGDDRVERVVIEPGVFREGRIEVLSGVEAGDRVVVRGQARLVDGALVHVRSRSGVARDRAAEGASGGGA